MTGPRPAGERISLWLEEEAVGFLPDRVLDATFDRTRDLRQASRSGWRPFSMSRPIPALIAVGAAAIVIALGVSLSVQREDPRAPAVGAPPSLSPSPSIQPKPPIGLAIVNVDGSIRSVLGAPPDAWMPDLSNDGTMIVYRSSESGTPKLVVAPVDGSAPGTSIVLDPSLGVRDVGLPVWSPDGTRIAFQGFTGDGNIDIYVADSEGRPAGFDVPKVTRLTSRPGIDDFPAWSADGVTVYYSDPGAERLDDSGFSATQEIWSVPGDGKGAPTRLTANEEPDTMPEVAANGSVLYWHAGDVWMMDADGTSQTRLDTVPAQLGFNPRLSPDGDKAAVLRYDPSERGHLDPSLRLPTDLPLLDVVVVDTTSGRVLETGVRVASDLNAVSWTPDGRALLIARYDQR